MGVSSARKILVVLTFMCWPTNPAISQDAAFCFNVNRVAREASLRQYTDNQIENGLCMTSKLAAQRAGSDAGTLCMRAAEFMMIEFQRRFPGRAPNTVIGRC